MNVLRVFAFLSLSVSICYGFEDKSILQYLKDNGYSLFVNLLHEAKLDMTLDGGGPYTVLAPTNVAIAKIDPDLLLLLNKNDLLLKNVVRYHILNGFTLIPEFQSGKNEIAVNGQAISVSNVNNTILLNNGTSIKNGDIILNNGVVQPVDNVLIPPIFSTNNLAAELIIRDDMFQEFFFALLLTNMTDLIERGEYTIFAPTDAAFAGTVGKYFYRDMPNAVHFYLEMLRYHIVPGARFSSMLKKGDVLYTLHGSPIQIDITSAGVFADHAEVIAPDIGASNGVIHAVNELLFPADLLKELEDLQAQTGTNIG